MAIIKVNLDRYLSEMELGINYLMYDYAREEPLIPGDQVTMLSPNDGPYFPAPGRFDFYNQDGELYITDMPIEEFEQRLPGLLDVLPEPKTFEVEDLEAILSLVKEVEEEGCIVNGYCQTPLDTWDVIDPLHLSQHTVNAVDKNVEFEPTRYFTVSEEECLTLIDNFGNKIMCESDKKKTQFHTENDYFEIIGPNGTCLLDQIPLEDLAAVLYSLLNGMTVAEVKDRFLNPYNMTRDQVEECSLVYDRYMMSEKRQVETVSDLVGLDSLLPDPTYPGYYGEYSYWLDEEVIRISRPIGIMDLPVVFAVLNMEQLTVTAGDGADKVSFKLLSEALDQDILIYRVDRIQTRVCDTSELEYEDGKIVNFLYEPRKDKVSLSTFRETLFTGINQETQEELFKEFTFSQAVARLIMLQQENS